MLGSLFRRTTGCARGPDCVEGKTNDWNPWTSASSSSDRAEAKDLLGASKIEVYGHSSRVPASRIAVIATLPPIVGIQHPKAFVGQLNTSRVPLLIPGMTRTIVEHLHGSVGGEANFINEKVPFYRHPISIRC